MLSASPGNVHLTGIIDPLSRTLYQLRCDSSSGIPLTHEMRVQQMFVHIKFILLDRLSL